MMELEVGARVSWSSTPAGRTRQADETIRMGGVVESCHGEVVSVRVDQPLAVGDLKIVERKKLTVEAPLPMGGQEAILHRLLDEALEAAKSYGYLRGEGSEEQTAEAMRALHDARAKVLDLFRRARMQ